MFMSHTGSVMKGADIILRYRTDGDWLATPVEHYPIQ